MYENKDIKLKWVYKTWLGKVSPTNSTCETINNDICIKCQEIASKSLNAHQTNSKTPPLINPLRIHYKTPHQPQANNQKTLFTKPNSNRPFLKPC